jgi:oligopeptide transport system ATP-binding protein
MTDLLQISHMKKYFPARKGMLSRGPAYIRAVDDVSFALRHGETLGLVGESGCGKSTTGRCALRLLEADDGQILFEGQNISKLDQADMRPLRKDMQIIFQDPYASLNPRLTIREIIEEGLIVHRVGSHSERQDLIEWVLKRVGILPSLMERYPHEFSGGQRQRIGIARALVLGPKLIVADEPVSALDVSIQAQVMNLLVEIQEEYQLSYLVIAHDLAVIEYLSDRVAVMYLGKIVEMASDRDIYASPKHPYTQLLLASIPTLDAKKKVKRTILSGEVPSPLSPLEGCGFAPRCPKRFDPCGSRIPPMHQVAAGHSVACHLYGS